METDEIKQDEVKEPMVEGPAEGPAEDDPVDFDEEVGKIEDIMTDMFGEGGKEEVKEAYRPQDTQKVADDQKTTMSPLPSAVLPQGLSFPEAMRAVIDGCGVSKKEWGNINIHGMLKDGWLMLHKDDNKFHQLQNASTPYTYSRTFWVVEEKLAAKK